MQSASEYQSNNNNIQVMRRHFTFAYKSIDDIQMMSYSCVQVVIGNSFEREKDQTQFRSAMFLNSPPIQRNKFYISFFKCESCKREWKIGLTGSIATKSTCIKCHLTQDRYMVSCYCLESIHYFNQTTFRYIQQCTQS